MNDTKNEAQEPYQRYKKALSIAEENVVNDGKEPCTRAYI